MGGVEAKRAFQKYFDSIVACIEAGNIESAETGIKVALIQAQDDDAISLDAYIFLCLVAYAGV